jgi:hypothetical protein
MIPPSLAPWSVAGERTWTVYRTGKHRATGAWQILDDLDET